MAKGRLRLLSTIPGPRNLGPIVRDFCKSASVVTAFSDSGIKTLAGMLPGDSSSEAVPFGSVVRRFATLCGQMPLPIAREGHVVAAVGAASDDLPIESPLSATAHRQGLHRAVAETLHEMSEYGLGADEYDALAAKTDENLALKLTSIGMLERQAADTLRQLGRGFARDLHALCIAGAPEKGADLGRIFVLAGAHFNPQAIRLIQWAVANGARITVVIYRHPNGGELFKGSILTASALGQEAEEVGRSNELLDNLFTETSAPQPNVICSVVSAADPLAETEWALRGCLERRSDGTPYESQALYVRDTDSYAPLIEASAKRLGVPIRMWRRAPLLTNSFARLTLAALEFCASKDVRKLLALSRTSYVSLTFEAREELSAEIKSAHGLRTGQWKHLREWAAAKEDGFIWLQRLLAWRDEAIANPVTLEAWIGKLYELMTTLPQSESNTAARERDKRALFVLQQSLSQIASVQRLQGPRSITLSEFARFATGIWSDSDVSVPAGEQGVLVASHADALPPVECLFVLGMLEGVFPRRRSEDPILSDFDREAISELRRGSRLPTSRDKAEEERDEFYCVCAAASNEIVFSYPETDEERDNVPAFYLDEVERALGGIGKVSRPRKDLTPKLEACIALSDKEIRRMLDSEPVESPPPGFTDQSTPNLFTRPASLGLQPVELREALQCPFSYFAKRTLGLRPERLRARWFSLVRLPQAAGLIQAGSSEEAMLSLEAELDKHLDTMYSEIPEWEIALLRSGGKRLAREWVEREFAARKIWPKEEVHAEMRFGEGGLLDVLPNIVPKLRGSVSGMSRTGGYSVVHLVETSGPAKVYGAGSELTDQDKLYYGLHFLANWDKNSKGAIEIETMAGERILMLLPRLPGANLPARIQDGLRVIDLGGGEDSGGPRVFFKDVKDLAREAVARIEKVDVRAIRGDHCAWCDYGELCRNSSEFGEEDSPFADEV
jgi:hypothetical protein